VEVSVGDQAKAMQRSEGKGESSSNSGPPDTPQVAVVNFGPKYELHMAEKQKQLDTATNLYAQCLSAVNGWRGCLLCGNHVLHK
jgi:hypothetical protein